MVKDENAIKSREDCIIGLNIRSDEKLGCDICPYDDLGSVEDCNVCLMKDAIIYMSLAEKRDKRV